jgi:hypothetical protein
MSECRYYRFECLDSYLGSKQREALRQISSRAEITATSFQVYYHYSGLKAEVYDVVLNYFDIGFYYADWDSIDVYIKLPTGTLLDALLQFSQYGLSVHESDQWQLLVFSIEEYREYFDDEQANDFFQYLVTLRAELMQGDWRLLYFMWLKEFDSVDDIATMPMLEFDFNNLTKAQLVFAELFDISLELVKALAQALTTNPSHRTNVSYFSVDNWLAELTEQEKNNLLKAIFEQGQLTRQQAIAMTKKEPVNKQMAYQYWLNAKVLKPYVEMAQKQFKEEQAAVLAQLRVVEKAAKEVELAEVYRQRDHVWQQAQTQAKRACASGYDQASREVHQLAEAYQFKGERTAFELRFKRFVSNNNNRKALLKRLQALSLGA